MKENRRRLIKSLTLGGGAVTLSKLQPTWTRPVVESVVLPAHAQTTTVSTPPPLRSAATSGTQSVMIDKSDALGTRQYAEQEDVLKKLMQVYLPDAHAGGELYYLAEGQAFAQEVGNGKWIFEFFFDFGNQPCEDSTSGIICYEDVNNEVEPNPLNALMQKAHAGPGIFTSTFQSLFKSGPLAVGEMETDIVPTGCDFGLIRGTIKFVSMNSSNLVATFKNSEPFTLNIPGTKQFGNPICDNEPF